MPAQLVLVQIFSPSRPQFVAGLVAKGDRIVQAAPILGWTVGRSLDFVRDYYTKRNCLVTLINESNTRKA